jgi:hypothetical protein
VAEREMTVTTLIVAARNFLIVVSVLSDCVSDFMLTARPTWVSSPGPLGPQLAAIGCTGDARVFQG